MLLSAIRYRNRLSETELNRKRESRQIFSFYKSEQIEALIPPETAVVECFWADAVHVLDIFVIAKEKMGTRFMYHTVRVGSKLRRHLEEWIECMHTYKGKNEKRSVGLYNKILAPVEGMLCHKKHIWICPPAE